VRGVLFVIFCDHQVVVCDLSDHQVVVFSLLSAYSLVRVRVVYSSFVLL